MSYKGGDNMQSMMRVISRSNTFKHLCLEGGYPVYPYTRPSDGNLLPDDQLQAFIENLGIAHDTTVILYSKSSGAIQPFRTAWALMYAGVRMFVS